MPRPTHTMLYPLHDQRHHLENNHIVDVHHGRASVGGGGDIDATILVTATGRCIMTASGSPDSVPSLGLNDDFRMKGQSETDGAFDLICPQFSGSEMSPRNERSAWAIGAPVNEAMTITYDRLQDYFSVRAHIQNFDFDCGNVKAGDSPHGLLRVEAEGREVDFTHRPTYAQLKQLAKAGFLHTASLNVMTFKVWQGATEEEVVEFAHQVARLCALISEQHSGLPVVDLLDEGGRVVKRFIGQTVESRLRPSEMFGTQVTQAIPQVFTECFTESVKMQKSPLPWSELPSRIASIDDPPYLEQKFASLMMSLEFFMKNCLLEMQTPPQGIDEMAIPTLVGACRRPLGWNIPSHYTAADLYRLLRNAVAHGGKLPIADSREFRANYDKWRLFLVRRVLIRLGYTGKVYSPHYGGASSSPVNDFSKEHNTYR
jgi:hypothetical protein